MMRLLMVIGFIALMGAVQASSIETYRFDTAEKETLYKKMIAELRCLVCQNQNLSDSNAELAQDLRRKTYELVTAGKNETEIIGYMVQRYGDFVLYRPPFKNITLLLWLGPFMILAVGVFVVLRVVKKRSGKSSTVELSDVQRQKAEQLLRGDDQ